ncbi:MAG: DUF1566 domain-containing protein, partial [Rhodoferax sp.]|nr:DUF1566 domain-containing protein [Rhodoferax sp.]
SSSYTTPAMSIAGSGVEYSVVISNSAGSVTSRSATLTVTSSSSAPSYGLVVNTSGGTHEITDCIQDSSTGLFWEGKTDSGARAASNAYTNYDSTVSAQKTDGSNPTQAEIDAETNSIGYVNYVNRIALCGFTDWRMPSIAEIKGIVDKSQLAEEAIKIDSTWFPHSQTLFVWTSTPDDYAANAIGFDFADGENGYYRSRYQPYPVRLVRGSQ